MPATVCRQWQTKNRQTSTTGISKQCFVESSHNTIPQSGRDHSLEECWLVFRPLSATFSAVIRLFVYVLFILATFVCFKKVLLPAKQRNMFRAEEYEEPLFFFPRARD